MEKWGIIIQYIGQKLETLEQNWKLDIFVFPEQ